MFKKLITYLCASLSLISFSYAAQNTPSPRPFHPLYVGVLGGGGSTTWYGLVPKQNNQNMALGMSTPTFADEGGPVWGLLTGFEFNPFFAFEVNYISYPKAHILFDDTSLFSFTHDGLIDFYTKTEAFNFMAKIMLYVPDTKLRVFSSAGAANVHRADLIMNDWRTGPSFGVGFNYPIKDQIIAELAGNYTAGYGESTLTPTDTYFPFLYSVTLRVAYHF